MRQIHMQKIYGKFAEKERISLCFLHVNLPHFALFFAYKFDAGLKKFYFIKMQENTASFAFACFECLQSILYRIIFRGL